MTEIHSINTDEMNITQIQEAARKQTPPLI